MWKSSNWLIDRTLPGATNLRQSGPGSNDNEGVLHISQSFMIEASPADCLVSYSGHSMWEFYPSVEMQSVYSTSPSQLGLQG